MKETIGLKPFDDSEFDLRARAELALAYAPGQAPASLFRQSRWLLRPAVQRAIAALLLLGTGVGAVFAMRPPELVRGAIEHEYYERTLRGNFMEGRKILEHLGLRQSQTLPGYPQLMRPCDIEGHLVYHLTTFFEKGGMVTVFAFDQPVKLSEDHGWWGNVYWQVVASRDGKPLVMVAQKKHALSVAQATFSPADPAQSPP
ncbi:hypothetical protein B9Z44_12355 [Limnohabitans curvus]|jgi:hypothetical protein|uniref:DUF3379 domain-containing protein n=1 Tax=Limnohabitans curvus TaxID=323423 RepID=A0A315EWD4_9BURK|nr:hypothetical protein [Limnohabitans curvus]PUE60292.1 hypothetical protein B9Z44_12355 [Limnohabitans curvus]